MKSTENYKNFDFEIEQIEHINSLQNKEIEIHGLHNFDSRINKQGTKLFLESNTRYDESDLDGKLSFTLNDKNFIIDKIHLKSTSVSASVDSPYKSVSTYEIRKVIEKDFNKKSTFKLFYRVDIEEIKSFIYEFETIRYCDEKKIYAYDCLRISIDNIVFDIVQCKGKTVGYYLIECHSEMDFNEFLKVCFSIKLALGFMTKKFLGDEEYVFDNSGKLYYSNSIRPSCKGLYKPIDTHPKSFKDLDNNKRQEIYNKLNNFSLENLSAFVSKIHHNSDFSMAILVILEVSDSRSLLIIPSVFTVVIETLSKCFDTNSELIKIPINDKEISSKIINELNDVIDSNSHLLDEKSVLKLKRRLKEINRPINNKRLTNNEKLTRPFEDLNIKLSLHDIEIIETRNDFLHGDISIKRKEFENDEEINDYLLYVSAKLYTLLSKLIFKSIGYEGYIYNNSKYLEKYINIETDEDYYEFI